MKATENTLEVDAAPATSVKVSWWTVLGIQTSVELLVGMFETNTQRVVWQAGFVQRFMQMQNRLEEVGGRITCETCDGVRRSNIPANIPVVHIAPEELVKMIEQLYAATKTN